MGRTAGEHTKVHGKYNLSVHMTTTYVIYFVHIIVIVYRAHTALSNTRDCA